MQAGKVFSLDLGLNNVGWAIQQVTEEGTTILDAGVYVFASPLSEENDPTSGLKSRDRGLKRRQRRTGRRRAKRRQHLYRELEQLGLLPSGFENRDRFLSNFIDSDKKEVHPYALRSRAIEEPLTPHELGRVLAHINQRRGFLSPRKLMALNFLDHAEKVDDEVESADEELKGMLGEIEQTRKEMKEHGHKTLGQYLYWRLGQKLPVRKKQLKGAKPKQQKEEDALRFNRADRQMLIEEFDKIIAFQKTYHPLLTETTIAKLRGIVFDQRQLKADKSLTGKCTFYPKEYRSPRAGLTAQKFIIAQELAHLRFLDPDTGEIGSLGAAARNSLTEALMAGEDLTWDEIRHIADLSALAKFETEPVSKRKAKPGAKSAVRGSQTVFRIKRAVGTKWDQLDELAQRNLVDVLVSVRDWISDKSADLRPAAQRRFDLLDGKPFGENGVIFTAVEAANLATLDLPDGYLNLSTKAIKKVLPLLIHGGKDGIPMDYSKAWETLGRNHSQAQEKFHNLEKLSAPADTEIRHPLVRCSVRSAVKVLNCMRAEYGQPDFIRIELPRDLARSAKQREEVIKSIADNEKKRREAYKELVAAKLAPTGTHIKKVLLWKEAQFRLPYSPDIHVGSIDDLINGPYEIDHIIPRSHNFDNSFGNLALCTRDDNQEKGDKTPFERWGSDPDRWSKIVAFARGKNDLTKGKRYRLTAKERPEGFQGRHLAAIGYIAKSVLALAQQMVSEDWRATVTGGSATAECRNLWGLDDLIPPHPEEALERKVLEEAHAKAMEGVLQEDRLILVKRKARSNFKHHCLDAIVIGLVDPSTLQKVTNYYKTKELTHGLNPDRAERQRLRLSILPDPQLRQKIIDALDQCHVVHRPKRRTGGELHKAQPKELPDRKGKPWGREVREGKLLHFDHRGEVAQAYPLANNHHVAIFESLTPNKKGVYERFAIVVSMMEAVSRRSRGLPVVCKTMEQPGWRFVMSLCKGDMVEMADGVVGVVSMLSPKAKAGVANIYVWHLYVAQQRGNVNISNGYLIANVQTPSALSIFEARIVLDPLGDIVYREGGHD